MEASPSTVDEAEWVRRALGGDRVAQSRLVALHRGPVYRLALRLTGQGALAEDVLQETFLVALRSLEKWRGEGSLRAWLYSIARSRALMAHRRTEARAEESVPLEELGLAAGWGLPPSDALGRRLEAREALEAGLGRLEAEEREVVVLRDVEGLSGEEAAAVLGLSLPAMKSRLHRGRLKLVAALREEAS